MNHQRSVLAFLVLSLWLSACTGGPTPTPGVGTAGATPTKAASVPGGGALVVEGRVVPRYFVTLAFRNGGGQVAEVLVRAGQVVTAGQLLVRLESDDLTADLHRAQASLGIAQAQKDQALVKARPEEIAAAEAQVNNAKALLAQARANLGAAVTPASADEILIAEKQVSEAEARLRYAEAVHDASSSGPNEWLARQQRDIAAVDVDIARARLRLLRAGPNGYERAAASSAVDAAAAQVALAEAQLSLLQATTRNEDVAVLDARIAEAEAAVAAIETAITARGLYAPFSGTVLDLAVKAGEVVQTGGPALTLADVSAWVVETRDLTEIDVVQLQVGQATEVVLDALPSTPLAGKLESISQIYTERQGDITYTATILLTETNANLRWGMTTSVKFSR